MNTINRTTSVPLHTPATAPLADTRRYVLIAEPDDSNYLYLSIVSRKLGLPVRRAATGPEAIETINGGEPIALILMNTHLPVIDGYDATARIMSLQKNLPVIALISSSFPEFSYRAVKAGCCDFLIMPVQPDVLAAKIMMWYKE